jgi:orotidine-5'-phosphate decarboxylase
LTGADRLIVALDVPSVETARAIVDELTNVRAYKIGWRLLMAGLRARGLVELWEKIAGEGKRIFVDLKVPDIGNTVADVVRDLREDPSILFLTLHQNMQLRDIAMARDAKAGSRWPALLAVPFVSSLDAGDFSRIAPAEAARGGTLNDWIIARTRDALDHGCDGVIASGEAIRLCREAWPRETGVLIVSPGIRPAGADQDDHKRSTTPTQAVRWGSDYLVVGRPILRAADRAKAAQAIIDEIDSAVLTSSN